MNIKPQNSSTKAINATESVFPLNVKEHPNLVKNIDGTTFDIHIHFSETSKETFTDKVVRLIQNDSEDKAT